AGEAGHLPATPGPASLPRLVFRELHEPLVAARPDEHVSTRHPAEAAVRLTAQHRDDLVVLPSLDPDRPRIPDAHAARAILSARDLSLELRVLERMVLRPDREAVHALLEGGVPSGPPRTPARSRARAAYRSAVRWRDAPARRRWAPVRTGTAPRPGRVRSSSSHPSWSGTSAAGRGPRVSRWRGIRARGSGERGRPRSPAQRAGRGGPRSARAPPRA